MFPMPQNAFKLLEGREHLSVYRWNTNVAEHFFCKTCGVYTHHNRRSDPTQVSVNAACLDGIDLSNADQIRTVDGASLE